MNDTRPAHSSFTHIKTTLVALGLLTCAGVAQATTVQIQTVLGDFEVNLFDKHTPQTVANFLAYVNAGAYTDTVVHRSVTGFVIQGGGFKYTGTGSVNPPLAPISANAPVINEPVFSNVRGTIAMAKLGGNPNSATNQWFINLSDNSQNLDNQNGGFTVFGQVTGNGMAIVDAIGSLKSNWGFGAPFGELPLRGYTSGVIDDTHLVMITGVVVLNPSPDTADNLNPKRRNPGSGGNDGGNKSGGGGGMGSVLWLSLLAGLGLISRRRKNTVI